MPSINDPSLSDFEKEEILREEAGEPPWTELPSDGVNGRQGIYDTRLESHPDWRLTAVFDIDSVDLPLLELRLRPATLSHSPEGITAEIVRSIHLNPLHTAVRNWVQSPPNVGPLARPTRPTYSEKKKTGPRGQDDLYFAEWASRYVDELTRTSNPVAALVRQFNYLNESTLRYYLNEARRRGLLTAAPSGRAGGQLTEKARELLFKRTGRNSSDT